MLSISSRIVRSILVSSSSSRGRHAVRLLSLSQERKAVAAAAPGAASSWSRASHDLIEKTREPTVSSFCSSILRSTPRCAAAAGGVAAAESARGSHNTNSTSSMAAAFLGTAFMLASTAMIAGSIETGHSSYNCYGLTTTTRCEEQQRQQHRHQPQRQPTKQQQQQSHLTPSDVARQDFAQVMASHEDIESMPIYTAEQVTANNGENGTPIWLTYGGVVYDVTDFVANHPGGSQLILQAAGSAVEPFWHLYRQHFASDLPIKLLENMVIGQLDEKDQDAIDEQMAILEDSEDDPYDDEPLRHRALLVHSDTPMNAETPVGLLTQSYLTPNSLFYIRHHHPVPNLSEEQIKDYHLTIDLSALPGTAPTSNKLFRISLDELRAMPKLEYNATLQCSGNRRSGFNAIERTSGTNWGQGAISTAKFGGVRLIDVMRKAGVHNFIAIQEEDGIHHVRFHALDGMSASVDIEKALGPYGDVLICYEMNGEPLPRDHGFPLRVIVPGYAAVRNVKWLERIELAATEAEGPWQRGLNYKILPPNVFDVNNIDVSQMPSVAEMSLYSGITEMKRISKTHMLPGDRVTLHVKGWAWAGGGRKVVRVDVTGDDGKSWVTANITEGANQRHRRAWAWVFWECHVPTVVGEDGIAQVASKAVDSSFNVQPEKANHEWNVRGLMNNSWYKSQARVIQAKRHTLGIVDLSQMDDEEESA